MCGIVSYWGQGDAVNRVLEALRLLQYRAPDSAGIAVLQAGGDFALRRSVGGPQNLLRHIEANPLFAATGADDAAVRALLRRQELALDLATLRDCSQIPPARLFEADMICVGVGDRGRQSPASAQGDVVAFAFRLLGARVAAREAVDGALREALDAALQARVGPKAYDAWRDAWRDEVAANVPGQAFAVAARRVQESIPELAAHLPAAEWERVGGLTALALSQMVMGHGRWAMVGAVTEENAHPLPDRSRSRIVCENGSHNARLMLGLRAEQEAWWRAHGVGDGEAVHRSDNTTEVIAYEWERMRLELDVESPPSSAVSFLERLDEWGVDAAEERALRLALWRIREGNAHACALYSRHRPDAFYVSSHHKPVAIITRTVSDGAGASRQDVMVASDVNAGLMLWTDAEVDAAAEAIRRLQVEMRLAGGETVALREAIDRIISHFTVEVIFLDADLFQGAELLARVSSRVQEGNVVAHIDVSRYDGTPLSVRVGQLALDPTMVGKGSFNTYIESHIAEIPDVLDGIVRTYVGEQGLNLDSAWLDGKLSWPGLNVTDLQARFGEDLSGLQRILLLGEGSSWRDAQVAAPLFRVLLPHLTINVYRPVELLNLGIALDPPHDLAIEISWSGTTDSLLKVDALLAELGLLRLAVTGRAQSDLGRRAAASGGVLDVRSGVEVSVATVKGFQAILMTLNLLALRLAELNARNKQEDAGLEPAGLANRSALLDELSLVVPRHVRRLVGDEERRQRLHEVARRCRHYNKVVVVGASPIDLEGELKIEEVAQVVGLALDFHDTSLRPLIERGALVDTEAARALFVFNVTSSQAHAEARPLIAYLQGLDLFCIIHSTPHAFVAEWRDMSNTAVFETPQVSPHLQPLLDAPFFFDFAVALAYARDLTPAEIDSPRNLAKSVTTTGAERRSAVEARPELDNIALEQFAQSAAVAWNAREGAPTRAAFAATVALRAALSVLGDPLPERLDLTGVRHLLVVSDTEATENGAQMAAVAWHELLGIDLVAYRRFISSLYQPAPDTAWLTIVRAGAVLALRDAHTVALPADMSPLQLEMLSAVYLTGLAIRLARRRGQDVAAWQSGLAQMPLLVDGVLSDPALATAVTAALSPYLSSGYDKVQIVGGGQDYAAAASMARSLRMHGFVAEDLYTDSAWHGPLAAVGGGDAEHDTLIIILATDPLFQAAALVDTQVYRTRNAPVILVVPQGNEEAPTLRDVQANAVIALPPCPRPFLPLVNAAFGEVLARQMANTSA